MGGQCQHDGTRRISPPQDGVQRVECGECLALLELVPAPGRQN